MHKEIKHIWYKWPLAVALTIWLLSYFATNSNLYYGNEKELLSIADYIRNDITNRNQISSDSVLFINTSYDKQLVSFYVDQVSKLDQIGNTSISDRSRLLTLMRKLSEDTTYKYVLLDISFEEGFETEYDSALFATILSMPRLVVPSHTDGKIVPELIQKNAIADYSSTMIESDFVKYPYYYGTQKSVALKMYEDLTGHSIVKKGPFFFDGMRLARKSIFVVFEVFANNYLNIGTLCDEYLDDVDFSDMFVVVGSFNDDDIHSTYVGKMPGSVINLNAFFSLLHNHHKVSIFVAFFYLLIIYYFSLKTIMGWSSLLDKSNRNSPIVKYVFSWFTYPLVLTIVGFVIYIMTNEVYDIFITTLLFEILNIVCNIIHIKKYGLTEKK